MALVVRMLMDPFESSLRLSSVGVLFEQEAVPKLTQIAGEVEASSVPAGVDSANDYRKGSSMAPLIWLV
jgi:hypothetical protein